MKDKKILLLGKNGQLGKSLNSLLPSEGLIALGRADCDLTNLDQLRKVLREHKPNIIVNAAGYTLVDQAGREESIAMRVNGEAVGVIAEETKNLGALLIHYSTDYVFDGEKEFAYVEDDQVNPINVYGASKLTGEKAIEAVGPMALILRTSWIYSLLAEDFVVKVLRWARQHKTMKIVDDQIGSPTWAVLLARLTQKVIQRENLPQLFEDHKGIYHVGGKGMVSRYDWAREILKLDPNKGEQVVEVFEQAKSFEFPSAAKRPLNSALDCSKFETVFKIEIPDWKVNLFEAMTPGES